MIKLNHSISNSNPQYYTTVETEVKVTFLAALLGKTPCQIPRNVGTVQLVKYPKYLSASLQSIANVCTSILSKLSLRFSQNGSAGARSRQVLPYSGDWFIRHILSLPAEESTCTKCYCTCRISSNFSIYI